MSNAFMNKNKKNKLSTETVVRVGLLISISVVLKLVLEIYVPIAGLPALRINFTAIPIMLSGIILGPFAGLITGTLSDLICFAVKPSGIFFPGFTLTSALIGFIPGLIYKYMNRNFNFNLLNTIFVLLISFGFVGVFFTNGVMNFTQGRLLYNGAKMNLIFPIIFIVLTVIYIVLPIKISQKMNGFKMDKILFTVSVTQLVTSIILNTYFLSILFGKGILVFLPGRIFTNYLLIPLYSMFIAVLMKSISSFSKKAVVRG